MRRADDAAGALRCCIAEVTNTPWADRVAFAFAHEGDALPKMMHVSPLQDMLSRWRLSCTTPAEQLQVRVDVKAHPQHGDFFFASLNATAVSEPSDPERWAFLMPHKVAWWIYYHAAVLLLRKGLSFYGHPKNNAGADYRLPAATTIVDEGWSGACPALGARLNGGGHKAKLERPCVWHDATEKPFT